MKIQHISQWNVLVFIVFLFFSSSFSANANIVEFSFVEMETHVQYLMRQGDIPGLSLAVILGEKQPFLKGYGYADIERRENVTFETLFEIGSGSQSFTALALLQLEAKGLLDLNASVSTYLPWFFATHQGKNYTITLHHLLHHTSGIPWNSVSRIPGNFQMNPLEQTVRNIVGIELNAVPGTRFENADINYDILGFIIGTVSGIPYEEYIRQQILIPLGLAKTTVGTPNDPHLMATGYKIGFFAPRRYEAPGYLGNSSARHLISNGNDMARWLQFQMRMRDTTFVSLIARTHLPDRTIPPNAHDLSSSAMGWHVYQKGSGEIVHTSVSPNFSAYIGFRPEDKIGVVVLANSNSNATSLIGAYILDGLAGESPAKVMPSSDIMDKACSVLSGIFGVAIVGLFTFLGFLVGDIARGRRQFDAFTFQKTLKILFLLLSGVPFLVGVYLLPYALLNVSWDTAMVWLPVSLPVAGGLGVTAFGVSYVSYCLALVFPRDTKYKRRILVVVILSFLTGVANSTVIFLVAGSLQNPMKLGYLIYYFSLAIFLYVGGRKIVETNLIRVSLNIIYDLRIQLLENIFATSYQKFEHLDRGRVYATVNDDTAQIGEAAPFIVVILTSLVMISAAFLCLAILSLWAAILALVVIVLVATIYYLVASRLQIFFERSRDTRNVYMRLINGLLDGYKELSLHAVKKAAYKADVEQTTDDFRHNLGLARIKWTNAYLIGESFIVVLMGVISFGFPKLFPQMTTATLTLFIIVLLYLITPIRDILFSIPRVMELRVAWNRVQQFLKDLPASSLVSENVSGLVPEANHVDHLKVEDLRFAYDATNGDDIFTIGPINFEMKKGEVFFIIGGNGSGKTTLAKLLTGLYIPHQGGVMINGKPVENTQLGEYFSTVFSDFYLFEKLYNVNLEGRQGEIRHYLSLLELDKKVHLNENTLSTIDLSGGQRKRLALFQCYLENRPIYLFDEWAADQDPVFRKFFYRELLPKMKEDGKMVFAITHDDHYFDAADKILKLDMGKMEFLKTE